MAKQVRKPASSKPYKDEKRVTSERNTIKGASMPKGKHERSDANNNYKPTMLRPTKRG